MTYDLELLLDRLQLGESADFELKAAQGRDGQGAVPRDLWESYSAMANTDGGVIVLGVEDKAHRILGIKKTSKVLKALWDGLNDPNTISQNLCRISDVTVIPTEAGDLIRIQVPRATRQQRPVYIRNPIGGTYRRGHEGDYKVGEADTKRMLAEAMEESRDSALLEGFSLEDLDAASLLAYRNLFRSTKAGHPWLSLDDKGLLSKLGGWTMDRQTGQEGPTLAGVLMFGQFRPLHDALPHYLVDYQELPAKGAPERWLDRITTDGMWSGNLFDFYRTVYPKLIHGLKVPFRMEGGHHRVDETPVHEALREALVNTLIHGDYTVSVGILVQRRPDGFLFRNPGNLRVSLDQALEGGLSDCRNRSLQKMFQMIGEGEQAGSGLPKIVSAWKGQHWKAPDLEEQTHPEHTVLFLSQASLMSDETLAALDAELGPMFRTLPEAARLVLATAMESGVTTHVQLKAVTGLHAADLTQLLKDLKLQGLLAPEGRGRGMQYRLATPQHLPESPQHLALDPQHLSPDPQPLAASPSGSAGAAEGGPRAWARLERLAEPARKAGKLPRAAIEGLLLELCRDQFLSLQDLGRLLDRKATTLQNHYLSQMVRESLLEMRYADKPAHPQQAYRTRKLP